MLCELITAEGAVTACAAVPTVWLGLVQYLKDTGAKIPSLRAALVAGTKAPRPAGRGTSKAAAFRSVRSGA